MSDPILLRLTPTTVRVYLACVWLSGKVEEGRPFAASYGTLGEVTKLSPPTILQARGELLNLKLLQRAAPDGYFTVSVEPLKEFGYSLALETKSKSKALDQPKLPKRSKRKSAKLGVRGAKIFGGYGLEDRREATVRACRALGVAPTGRLVQLAMARLARLLKDGRTTDDAVAVAKHSRELYDRGDRWTTRLNILYVWSPAGFSALEASLKTTPFHQRSYTTIADPDARQQAAENYAAKLKAQRA